MHEPPEPRRRGALCGGERRQRPSQLWQREHGRVVLDQSMKIRLDGVEVAVRLESWPVWKSTSELGYPEKYCVDLREPPRHRADAITATTSRRWPGNSTPSSRRSYGDNIASMAWGARNLISTQDITARPVRAAAESDDRLRPAGRDGM